MHASRPQAAIQIDAIEHAIDNEYRLEPLYGIERRAIAQWYLLLMHEECIRLPSLATGSSGDWFSSLMRGEMARAALQWALRWTDDLAQAPSALPDRLDPRLYQDARSLFALGGAYYGIVGPFTLYRSGLMSAQLDNDNTITFNRHDKRDAAFEVLAARVTQDPEAMPRPPAPIGDLALQQLAALIATAHTTNRNRIRYRVRPRQLIPLVQHFAQDASPSSSPPDDWSILGIKWIVAKRFLAAARARCFAHLKCIASVTRRDTVPGGDPLSAILSQPIKAWVRELSLLGNIPEDATRLLLGLLTYDRTLPKRDISLQPWLPTIPGWLSVCPSLVVTGNLERNLLALLARVRKQDFDNVSHVFELGMISRCQLLARDQGWSTAANRPLRFRKGLPDVDIAFYEPSTATLLACQLKAVIAPSEPREVLERSQREREGLLQAQKVRDAAATSPADVWHSCFGPDALPNPRIFHAVLLQGSTGTARSLDFNIPSLEIDHFDALARRSSTLRALCVQLAAFEHLPREGRDYRNTHANFKFARIMIRSPAVELHGLGFW